jgi:hypothetical protein
VPGVARAALIHTSRLNSGNLVQQLCQMCGVLVSCAHLTFQPFHL